MSDDVKAAVGTAGAVTGAAATVGAATGASAAAAAAIGGAVGFSVPIPGLNLVIAAVAAAIAAITAATIGQLRDKFHPDALTAAAFLLLFRFCPGLVYAGIDTVTTETGNAAAHACRVVRYFRVISGIVPKGVAGNNGIFYNPNETCYRANNLPTDDCQTNQYIESPTPDPDDILTDVNAVQRIGDLVRRQHWPTDPAIPPLLATKAQAARALRILRAPAFAKSGVLAWEPFQNARLMQGLRIAVGRVRALAGERGPDEKLAALLGGPVDPPADAKLAGPGAEPPSGSFFTVGRVLMGAVVLAGGLAGWSLWGAYRSLYQSPPRKKNP